MRDTRIIPHLYARKMGQEILLFNNIEFYKIRDFPNYYVSKCGKVYSKKNNIILVNCFDSDKYYLVGLIRDKKRFTKTIHRLVSQAFIPNPKNKPCVNHKNGIKTDNRVENLEWCSILENNQHAYDIKLKVLKKGKENLRSKKIGQYDLQGNLIKTWYGLREIERKLGYHYQNIASNCEGKYKQSYNFIWKYL